MNTGNGFKSPVATGAMLVGLGLVGIALAIEYVARGQHLAGLGLLGLFLAIPALVFTEGFGLIPRSVITSVGLIALGIAYLLWGRLGRE